MPNTILPQEQNKHEIFDTVSSFFKDFHIGNLLKRCNALKEKGVPVLDIFKYKLCNVFADRSMYMQMKTGSFSEGFSKNTYYRFQNDKRPNWLRFTSSLSRSVARTIEPLTSKDRINAFVIDDTLFSRTGYKRTELASSLYDHVSGTNKNGFRLLTLGWTDGNTFLPINSSLLASSNPDCVVCEKKYPEPDGRSNAAKIRKLARTKGTKAMLELIKEAVKAGYKADYVLFDSWFSSPAQLLDVKNLGFYCIAMVKKNDTKYEYDGRDLNIKEIFKASPKRRGRSKYLLSVNVNVGNEEQKIPAKIVYVRNRNNSKDWVAFICTNPELSEEEIIRIYGKRWDIEVFFKTCKSYLKLLTECHSISFDALTAHVAIVFTRYMMLALEQRRNTDARTIGGLFLEFVDELKDIKFAESLQIIMSALLKCINTVFHITDEQVEAFISEFIEHMPGYIKKAFARVPVAG